MKLTIFNFFTDIWNKINELIGKLGFDEKVLGLYDQFIKDIPELFKWLIAIFLVIILIFGIIAFIKKTFKLFIILAVIMAAVIFFTN